MNLAATMARPTPAAPLRVEESRTQRLQRQQARFRDRGGIFVPSNRNTLVDILLARSVTGESPGKDKSKERSRLRNTSCSPVRKGKEKEKNFHDSKTRTSKTAKSAAAVSKNKAIATRKTRKKSLHAQDCEEPGPPICEGTDVIPGKEPRKGHTDLGNGDHTEGKTEPKRRSRPPKSKSNPPCGPTQADEQDAPLKPQLSAKPQSKAVTTKKRRQIVKLDDSEGEQSDYRSQVATRGHAVSTKSAARPRPRAKAFARTVESDGEVEERRADHDGGQREIEKGHKGRDTAQEKRSKGKAEMESSAPTKLPRKPEPKPPPAKKPPSKDITDDCEGVVKYRPQRTRAAKPKGAYIEISDDDDEAEAEQKARTARKKKEKDPPLSRAGKSNVCREEATVVEVAKGRLKKLNKLVQEVDDRDSVNRDKWTTTAIKERERKRGETEEKPGTHGPSEDEELSAGEQKEGSQVERKRKIKGQAAREEEAVDVLDVEDGSTKGKSAGKASGRPKLAPKKRTRDTDLNDDVGNPALPSRPQKRTKTISKPENGDVKVPTLEHPERKPPLYDDKEDKGGRSRRLEESGNQVGGGSRTRVKGKVKNKGKVGRKTKAYNEELAGSVEVDDGAIAEDSEVRANKNQYSFPRSKKRRRADDTKGAEEDGEEEVPAPTARKRTKTRSDHNTDEEGKDESVANKGITANKAARRNGRGKANTQHSGDAGEEVATKNLKVVDKAVVSPKVKTAKAVKQSKPKQSKALARKGPPESVLNRVRTVLSPVLDTEPDPIDFLS